MHNYFKSTFPHYLLAICCLCLFAAAVSAPSHARATSASAPLALVFVRGWRKLFGARQYDKTISSIEPSFLFDLTEALACVHYAPYNDEGVAFECNEIVRSDLDKWTFNYSQYKPWRLKNKNVFSAVVANTGELIGFFDIFPLTDESATSILSGKRKENTLNPDDIVPFESLASSKNIYIASLMINRKQKRFNNRLSKELMTIKLFEFIDQTYSPVNENRFIAYAHSRSGEQILKRCGFTLVVRAEDTKQNSSLYVLEAGQAVRVRGRFDRIMRALCAFNSQRTSEVQAELVDQRWPAEDTPVQASKPLYGTSTSALVGMTAANLNRIVEILADEALAESASPAAYFQRLVAQADIPQEFRRQRQGGWSGNARHDARMLVTWASAREINPADRRYTTLGSLLIPELNQVGASIADELLSIIEASHLIRDEVLLDTLHRQFLVPRPLAVSVQESTGPDINWRGPTTPAENQAWLRPEPDFLDVGLLKRAIDRARGVCLIEVGLTRKTGTGVLIDDDLLLTNHHVLCPDSTVDLKESAHTSIVRFGVFSPTVDPSDASCSVTLDANNPVVAASSSTELDFALLRLTPSIRTIKSVGRVPFSAEIPAVRSGLNILQHPEGLEMKLALSSNAVTATLNDAGLIQYVTRTAGGSSGAPCFDDDWRMVAIHHSERARSFGTIREGILMNAIYSRIKPHLSARPR
jgi:V8-like Glu-specific endopeptidase